MTMNQYDPVSYVPIGHVENNLETPGQWDLIRKSESRIVLDPALVAGLKGLAPGQKLMVLFHLHLSRDYELTQHPRGDTTRPKRGVFTIRSPKRPNPIGVTVVELVRIDGNILTVKGLDAFNGTPVLDLKPA